jgi:hypothetical protein
MTHEILPCDVEPTEFVDVAQRIERGSPTAMVAGSNPAVHAADLALFDPHLASECPECGHGHICSPALCSRKHPVRTLIQTITGRPMLATQAALAPDNVVQFRPKPKAVPLGAWQGPGSVA